MTAPAEALRLLDKRVERLTQARPELEQAARLQAALVRESIMAARPPRVEPFPLPRAKVVAKVRDGTPLLHGEPVSVDVHYAADLFSRLVNVLTTVAPTEHERTPRRLEALVAVATSGTLPPDRLFGEAFVQHTDHLSEMAAAAGVDADLLTTATSLSVAPLLRAHAEKLLPLLESADDGSPDGVAWQKGYCPICGAWPAFAELRGVELKRHMRCSACGSSWAARRQFCPYCETDDHRELSYLQVEGEPRFRVEICAHCRGYVKSVNAFDPAPSALVPLDDLASAHLDVAAVERGYRRPAAPGFRLELASTEESEWADDLETLD